ncbi:MAG: hypothetical protein SGILL_004607, partial [Bacillariaceae sp.]
LAGAFIASRIRRDAPPSATCMFATTPQHVADANADELFSVAPMMGHTNRHYRYFWRLLSQYSTLYTEMIPASTIVQAYEQHAKQSLLDTQRLDSSYLHHPDCIQQVLQNLQKEKQNPAVAHASTNTCSLDDLLRDDTKHGKITLQLGGRDPRTLATAAAIATAYQSVSDCNDHYAYSGINLNCGCPSTSVASGRRTGAALMLEPQHVVECLNDMTHAIHDVATNDDNRSLPTLSVKHRLGVQDADRYQRRKQELLDSGRYSFEQEEEEAYQSCRSFVSHLVLSPSCNHDVSRIQVHGRLALLGLSSSSNDSLNEHKGEPAKIPSAPSLWMPTAEHLNAATTPTKVNHQRLQYRAKQQARQATIDNRRIPPLHPNIVPEIAREFSSKANLQVVTNGGIESIQNVKQRTVGGVHGAMVGRAAINHPCAFSSVDALFGSKISEPNSNTRRGVLERYIQYCVEQEEEYRQWMQPADPSKKGSDEGVCTLRRALVAPAFHLIVGEDGNAEYQRLLKKLVGRAQRHCSSQILQAAMAQVPSATLDKDLSDHKPWDTVHQEFREKHGEAAAGATKRSGAMQRVIH